MYMLHENTILLYIHCSNNVAFLMNWRETPHSTYTQEGLLLTLGT